MKKIIGLCLAVMMSCSITLFAQDGRRGGDRDMMDPAKRVEKIVKDFNLNDDQAERLRKVENDYHESFKKEFGDMKERRQLTEAEREARRADFEKNREKMDNLRNERNLKVKDILSDEQYKKYVEMDTPPQRTRGERNRNR